MIPFEAFEQHSAIVGRTGSGKTYRAKTYVERLLEAQRRVCVVDPTGAWWGLRSSADGKSPGFPVVVFGGEHGDVPITEHAAIPLAEMIADGNMPCVVDVSEFMVGARHRFMQHFAETLYRKNRLPLHLIIDEADDFCPQNPLPETRVMLERVDRIVRRGRIRGFRVMMITQRPAALHKNILTQASTLVAMRLVGPQDRAAILAWIKDQADPEQGKEVIASLPSLRLGEGWTWAPDLGVLEKSISDPIKTYDSSATPEEGDEQATLAMADIDLSQIGAHFAAFEEEAKANDPKALKARIAELEKQVKAGKPAVDQAAVARAWQEGAAAGRADMAGDIVSVLGNLKDRIHESVTAAIREIANEVSEPTATPKCASPAPVRAAAAPVERRGVGNGTAASRPRAASAATDALHAAARGILDVLAGRYPASFTWQQAATLAGLKARGGHFNAGRKDLRERGLVDEAGDLIRISEAGRALVGDDFTAPQGPGELRAMWRSKLPSPAPDMLDYLADRSDFVPKAAMAEAIGKKPQGGHWNGGIAVLRNNGLIEMQGDRLRLCDELRG